MWDKKDLVKIKKMKLDKKRLRKLKGTLSGGGCSFLLYLSDEYFLSMHYVLGVVLDIVELAPNILIIIIIKTSYEPYIEVEENHRSF